MPQVCIGRSSGPSNDREISLDMTEAEINLAKDILAIVNLVSRDKEGWYIKVDGKVIVPHQKGVDP